MSATFSHLLLATEHSEFDVGAEALAFALARRCGLALAGVLPVVSNPEFETIAPQIAARSDAQASVKREQLDARARSEGVVLDLHTRHGAEPFAEIVQEGRDRAADLIIIRRRGRVGLLANLLLGELVSKVLAHAPCSVLVVPRDARMWSRKVLFGLNPHGPDDGALARAIAVAVECDLPLHIVSVIGNESERGETEQALETAVMRATALGCKARGECRLGKKHVELIAAAEASGADLLLVGRHGSDHLGRAWVGGVTQKVIGLASCPVLVHVSKTKMESP